MTNIWILTLLLQMRIFSGRLYRHSSFSPLFHHGDVLLDHLKMSTDISDTYYWQKQELKAIEMVLLCRVV